VKFHAAGDAAVRQAVDAIEAARMANGTGGPAHDVGYRCRLQQLRRSR